MEFQPTFELLWTITVTSFHIKRASTEGIHVERNVKVPVIQFLFKLFVKSTESATSFWKNQVQIFMLRNVQVSSKDLL